MSKPEHRKVDDEHQREREPAEPLRPRVDPGAGLLTTRGHCGAWAQSGDERGEERNTSSGRRLRIGVSRPRIGGSGASLYVEQRQDRQLRLIQEQREHSRGTTPPRRSATGAGLLERRQRGGRPSCNHGTGAQNFASSARPSTRVSSATGFGPSSFEPAARFTAGQARGRRHDPIPVASHRTPPRWGRSLTGERLALRHGQVMPTDGALPR